MKVIAVIIMVFSFAHSYGQSETTQQLHKDHENAFDLFFYKNSLHMINMGDDKEFASLISGIDKMKFLRLNKEEEQFTREDFNTLMAQYNAEEFEEMMSMRDEGKDVKVYIKEKDKETLGLVMLINDEESLSILDIKGSIPLNKILSVYDKVKTLNL